MEAVDIRRLVAIRDTVAALLLAEATRQGVTVDELTRTEERRKRKNAYERERYQRKKSGEPKPQPPQPCEDKRQMILPFPTNATGLAST